MPLLFVFHKEPCPEATKYSAELLGLTAMSTTRPPVKAGPMLLNLKPDNEIFLSESTNAEPELCATTENAVIMSRQLNKISFVRFIEFLSKVGFLRTI